MLFLYMVYCTHDTTTAPLSFIKESLGSLLKCNKEYHEYRNIGFAFHSVCGTKIYSKHSGNICDAFAPFCKVYRQQNNRRNYTPRYFDIRTPSQMPRHER